jgi:hypothetical protein
MGYLAKLEVPGARPGEDGGATWFLDDLEAPNNACAVSLPVEEVTGAAYSSCFFLPPKSEPKNPSLSFWSATTPFPFLPPLSLPHFPNKPFLSFSFRAGC